MNIGWAILKAHSSRSVNIPRKAYHRPKHRNNALPRLPLPHVPFPSLDFASSLAHSASNRSPSAFIKGREYCNKCSQNPGIAKIDNICSLCHQRPGWLVCQSTTCLATHLIMPPLHCRTVNVTFCEKSEKCKGRLLLRRHQLALKGRNGFQKIVQ